MDIYPHGTCAIAREMDNVRSRSWNWVLFNYTQVQEVGIQAIECKYLIYGHEICPKTTKPHLQGFIVFESQKTKTAALKFFQEAGAPDASLHPVGKDNGCARYARKDGVDVFEKGTPPEQGKRSDIHALNEYIRATPDTTMRELRRLFPAEMAKYSSFAERVLEDVQECDPPTWTELKPWQQDIWDRLQLPPDDRKVFIVCDPVGGAGKSSFARYIMCKMQSVQYFTAARDVDICFAISSPKVLIFDFARSVSRADEPWPTIEAAKNGIVFSPKYSSGTKKFKPPHVLVLMNTPFDPSKLTTDRVVLFTVSSLAQ